ncbi:unnamed protein product [Rhizophagus irregularis]|nr:unnamed protein product [Rhizophagus irregularis]
MTITVYGHSASSFTIIVFYVLKELGLSYEYYQTTSEEIKSPEYLATKHSFGKIPSLNDDGFQIYETRAIAPALVEQFISVGTSYYTESLIKLLAQVIGMKKQGNEPDLKIANEAREELGKTLDVYEKLLEGKDYLAGEFSLADLLHIPLTFYAIKAGEGDLWNKRPNVLRWWKNIGERECWKNIVTEYKLDDVV